MSIPQHRGTHGDDQMNENTDTITGDLTRRHGLAVREILAHQTVGKELPLVGSEPRLPDENDHLVVENWLACLRQVVVKDLEACLKAGDVKATASVKATLNAIDTFVKLVMVPIRAEIARIAVVRKLVNILGAN